jgi:hypothetical protein
MEKVALKLLEHPELCNIDNKNNKGDTALICAKNNSLDSVLMHILEVYFNKRLK